MYRVAVHHSTFARLSLSSQQWNSLDRINVRLATTTGDPLCLLSRRIVLLRSWNLGTGHVEGRRRAARSLEIGRGSRLRMLRGSIWGVLLLLRLWLLLMLRLMLMLRLLFCKRKVYRSGILDSIFRRTDMYIHRTVLFGLTLSRGGGIESLRVLRRLR